MAFNFNWSPLTADASFYTRAQELLTTALNKSPKPPIIVDDILVNELNLGSVPPDLEILEIGDLAEDHFRGIFKMCYSGDAFLTLKTRVQANPLNTYLSTKPSFTSPQPLAASSGLTIPIQITLSEIKLSAFIVLVFSRQKGLTLVFRNDPLESLKVSSTFDAIPFVREYLQKEIEGQLRRLLMDEVPVIIHRLSQRLFVPEYREKEEEAAKTTSQETGPVEKPVDPFASPPQDPVDVSGNILDASQIASLSLDSGSEMHALFSQKNLLRLGALTDSHRTLSLFTPSIRDAVFRAWAGPTERGELHGSSGKATPITPALTRSHSYTGNTSTTYIFSDSMDRQHSTRPTLTSNASAASGLGLNSAKHSKPHGRKKKHRVVNLRKKHAERDDVESVSGESTTNSGSGAGTGTGSMSSPPSEHATRPRTPENPEEKEPGDWDMGNTPPRLRNLTPRHPQREIPDSSRDATPRASQLLDLAVNTDAPPSQPPQTHTRPSPQKSQSFQPTPPLPHPSPTDPPSTIPLSNPLPPTSSPDPKAAWMNQMASEIVRKVAEQKALARVGEGGFWSGKSGEGEEEAPPPPYAS